MLFSFFIITAAYFVEAYPELEAGCDQRKFIDKVRSSVFEKKSAEHEQWKRMICGQPFEENVSPCGAHKYKPTPFYFPFNPFHLGKLNFHQEGESFIGSRNTGIDIVITYVHARSGEKLTLGEAECLISPQKSLYLIDLMQKHYENDRAGEVVFINFLESDVPKEFAPYFQQRIKDHSLFQRGSAPLYIEKHFVRISPLGVNILTSDPVASALGNVMGRYVLYWYLKNISTVPVEDDFILNTIDRVTDMPAALKSTVLITSRDMGLSTLSDGSFFLRIPNGQLTFDSENLQPFFDRHLRELRGESTESDNESDDGSDEGDIDLSNMILRLNPAVLSSEALLKELMTVPDSPQFSPFSEDPLNLFFDLSGIERGVRPSQPSELIARDAQIMEVFRAIDGVMQSIKEGEKADAAGAALVEKAQ